MNNLYNSLTSRYKILFILCTFSKCLQVLPANNNQTNQLTVETLNTNRQDSETTAHTYQARFSHQTVNTCRRPLAIVPVHNSNADNAGTALPGQSPPSYAQAMNLQRSMTVENVQNHSLDNPGVVPSMRANEPQRLTAHENHTAHNHLLVNRQGMECYEPIPFDEISEKYGMIHKMFSEEVVNKEYAYGFLVPELDIADDTDVQNFLTIVGDAYKKLEEKFIKRESTQTICDILCCSKRKVIPALNSPKPKKKKLSDIQLQQEIMEFMNRANIMAYKLMFRLHIIGFDREIYICILHKWWNTKLACESSKLTFKDIISMHQNNGNNIVKYLMEKKFKKQWKDINK